MKRAVAFDQNLMVLSTLAVLKRNWLNYRHALLCSEPTENCADTHAMFQRLQPMGRKSVHQYGRQDNVVTSETFYRCPFAGEFALGIG